MDAIKQIVQQWLNGDITIEEAMNAIVTVTEQA
jgi:hypothetical protein